MKKIFLCVLLLVLVASVVSAVDLFNPRQLKRAVQPYVQEWGEYGGYQIICHPVQGTAAGFFWHDEFGQITKWAVFAYIDEDWILYEASEELQKLPTNIG